MKTRNVITIFTVLISIFINISLAYADDVNNKSFEQTKELAEQGDATSQNDLGAFYYNGQGVAQDYAEAVKWYRKAADQGYALAQYNLGVCYEFGKGVEKDIDEAVKWYRKATEQGYAVAQCNLGYCYENGRGVPQDYAEAVKWYRKSAEQGCAYAQCNLGNCYYNGQGVSQDYVEAVKWYRKAVDQGYARAQFCLGFCYENGNGVEKDIYEAVKWYRKAADQGDTFAKKKIDEYEAELKAAEERRIAEQKAAEKRRVAACDEYWKGLASKINEHKTYDDREKYLQTVKSQLLHDNNDGSVLLEEFASEYLPNTYAKYEKAREKSLEIGPILKSVFTKELDNNSPEWPSYIKATEKYSQILWEEKRIQNGISYIYLLHKVGACSDELLAVLDKSEKMNFMFEDDFKHDLNQYQTKKVDGVMEFAQKNMPETFALLEAFEKEIKETKTQFEEVYLEAQRLNYFYGNTSHSVFVAFEFKYKKTIEKYNAIMLQVKDLQIKHLLLEVTGDDLASQDSKISKDHKIFKDSLPEFVKTNALKGESHYVEEIIETMVQIPNKNYLMGKYEVTQTQWQAVMGNNPSRFTGYLFRPVEQVSWNDCQEFIKKLNSRAEVKQAGITFRLPTEEEWKYACRAGSTGKYGLLADGREGTLEEMGWYDGNSGDKTHPVGQKIPNAWGLYDMHGNVWEWTSSKFLYNPIFRGGSWGNYAENCEAGSVGDDSPYLRDYHLGFRLAASRTEK